MMKMTILEDTYIRHDYIYKTHSKMVFKELCLVLPPMLFCFIYFGSLVVMVPTCSLEWNLIRQHTRLLGIITSKRATQKHRE
ncbi:hypothetical protein JHK82_057383 [Glycine max]|uniref:Uncharacterized protein n=2 Tax=Glycine subgen. Soja TaxID=1462606 RepID=K7N5J2_SOYBN|nr:hypothetical protein JHK86_057216 [Glycine max]RZB45694.1 hypothetical protein D0Y65_055109 [Glycine soja]KAG5076043.1 hypothetical protein JHK84_057274 [Glycine max]KAG5078688.1 hypothetical protein JHK82_057383 [Glycine max]KAH1037849.1 hypothetical protein GYH30_056930 [Glycine max]